MCNRKWIAVIWSLNWLSVFHKMIYFEVQQVYLILMAVLGVLLLVFDFKKSSLFVGMILNGLFTLTLPMGMVMALIGSYRLAATVFLVFYLPSMVAIFMDLWCLKLFKN